LGKTKWAGITKEQFDDFLVNPLENLLFAMMTIVALSRLKFPEAWQFSINNITIQQILLAIATGIIIVCIVSLILRFLDFITLVVRMRSNLGSSPGERQLLFFFKDFIKMIVIIFGIIFILKYSFKLNIGNLLTGLSIVGAALALAAKESLENLIASFVIFFDKPFATGHLVKVKDITGTVERIGLRSTRIRTADKSLVTVPNKQMVDSVLDNWSSRDLAKNEMRILLSADSTSEELQTAISLIKEIFASKKNIDNFTVHLQDITNENALIMSIYYTRLTIPLDEANDLRQQLNLEIKSMQEQNHLFTSGIRAVKLIREDPEITSD